MARKTQKSKKVDFAKMPWQGMLVTPLQGPMGRIFVEGDEFLRSQMGRTLWYDEQTQTYQGSTHAIVTRADSRARELSDGAVRVPTLQDTEHSSFKDFIRGKHWADVPEAYVFTREGDFAERAAEIAEERKVSFDLPCRVTGLDVTPKGFYVARNDFALTPDSSLSYENNMRRFNRLENGFAIFDDNGAYTLVLRNNNSAWVGRDGSLGVSGCDAYFGCSDRGARVVFAVDAVGAPKISELFVRNLLTEYESLARSLREDFEKDALALKRAYDEISGKN